MRKISNRRLWSDGLLALLPNPLTRVDLTPLTQPQTGGTNPPSGTTPRPPAPSDRGGK